MSRYFTFSAWPPSGNFDLIRLNIDFLRHPEVGYFSLTLCLFGFGMAVTFRPHGAQREDFDADEWLKTTSVVVPMPEYDALVSDAEKWRAQYLADFGPNVPVEDLGGSYTTETESGGVTGMEKAP
jgi:hypothetical protein